MKGVNFLKPLEFKVEILGEIFKQGETIKGELSVMNHGGDAVKLDYLSTRLAHGVARKVKAQNVKGLTVLLEEKHLQNESIGPGENKSFNWKFGLDEDCPISDSTGGLYIIYGASENPFECGLLTLDIKMTETLRFFLEVFENFIRFKVKKITFKKGEIIVKMEPPKSREMSSVVALSVHLKNVKDEIAAIYKFDLKQLEAVSATDAKVTTKKKEFPQKLIKTDYMEFGALSHEKTKNKINEVIEQVIPRLYFDK